MSTSSASSQLPNIVHYTNGRTAGVTFIAITALISILSIIYLLAVNRPKSKTFKDTHIYGYFMCLLAANLIQSTGTVIDFEWISKGGVVNGAACAVQGGLKQAGDLGASFWSLTISVHIFLLLFFQLKSNRAMFVFVIVATWGAVIAITLIGRFILQKEATLGPYFGIAGEWCWIADTYQNERIFLECIFILVTIIMSFMLYTFIFLHVRGITPINLTRSGINQSMLEVAKKMIWYPVSSTAVMLPMTVIRILEMKYNVPFVLVTVTGVVLNSMGLVNVILLLYIARIFKRLDKTVIPQTFTPRHHYTGSLDKLREFQSSPDSLKDMLDKAQLSVVTVHLPTAPASTYMAPDSWKTTSPGGGKY